MPVPETADDYVKILGRSQLLAPDRIESFLASDRRSKPPTAKEMAERFFKAGLVTNFQNEQLLKGKFRGFSIGKYKVLERIGAGGMTNKTVAVKISHGTNLAKYFSGNRVTNNEPVNPPTKLGMLSNQAHRFVSLNSRR